MEVGGIHRCARGLYCGPKYIRRGRLVSGAFLREVKEGLEGGTNGISAFEVSQKHSRVGGGNAEGFVEQRG